MRLVCQVLEKAYRFQSWISVEDENVTCFLGQYRCARLEEPRTSFLDKARGNLNVKENREKKMGLQFESLVETIKSKVGLLRKKKKKLYMKMDKSSSVRVEIRRKKTRDLIDKTLKVADRPGKRTLF
ncbi:unnamed protein product [Microthlaspi erraticum]|uniref:Uncharacterized protein n=1 Tax=Microthlaspi erraticum TaxID=1685480 RepID=A0A6D2J510_9BRAS|nr:unnamed protein product [Microthlaspi erraticum]